MLGRCSSLKLDNIFDWDADGFDSQVLLDHVNATLTQVHEAVHHVSRTKREANHLVADA